MFTHDMVESKQPDITMHSIDPSAMESLVNFAYSGRITISTSNVQNLMLGANFLQLSRVRDACADFLQTRLSPMNVIGIRQFAESLGCLALVKYSDKFIQKNFELVAECDEFLAMGLMDAIELVSRDELHVSSEEVVFLAVMRWVKHKPVVRGTQLPQLLTKVTTDLKDPKIM